MEYEIQPGDYIIALAKKNNTTRAVIEGLNPNIKDFDQINSGDIINLPDASMSTPTTEVVADASGNEEVLLKQLETLKVDEAAPVVAETPVANQAQPTVVSPTAEKTFSEAAGEVNEIIGDKVQGVISYIQDKLSLDNITDLLKDKPYLYGFMQSKGLLLDKPNVEAIQKTLTETKAAIEETAKPILANPDSLLSQAVGLSKKGATEDEPEPDSAALEPAIAEDAQVVPVVSETGTSESNATQEKLDKLPPTPSDIEKLEKQYEVLGVGKDFFDQAVEALKGVKIETTFDAEKLYKKLSEDAVRETKEIDDRIAAVAAEKVTPTFVGFDKFLAVLGASLGAYGSSLTGTPNFALNIINNAIDTDAQQFLASQEIRTKSLLDQRQAVIQRRTDLLTLGINQADRMLKAAQTQKSDILDIAQLQSVKLGLENAAAESRNKQITLRIKRIVDAIAAEELAKTVQSKEERELGVKAISLKGADGKLNEFAAYFAATPIEGAQHRESWNQTYAISGILDKIDKVAGTTGAFMPGALSNTKTSLKNLSSQLIVHLKELYGMGANFTVFEQALVRDQTPTDGLLEQFKVWEQKSKDLRSQLIMKHQSRSGSQGGQLSKMPNAADAKKRDFIKAGVAPNG
jgi:hypothetical protein